MFVFYFFWDVRFIALGTECAETVCKQRMSHLFVATRKVLPFNNCAGNTHLHGCEVSWFTVSGMVWHDTCFQSVCPFLKTCYWAQFKKKNQKNRVVSCVWSGMTSVTLCFCLRLPLLSMLANPWKSPETLFLCCSLAAGLTTPPHTHLTCSTC